MTFDEFKAWLNKLVADKKGALPDLADWKKIKENLDNVRPDVIDPSGYSILSTYSERVLSGRYGTGEDTISPPTIPSPGVSIYETTNDVWSPEDVINPAQYLGYDMKLFDDLEYFLNKTETLTAIPEWYYHPLEMHAIEATFNGTKIELDKTNGENTESYLNSTCSGK